MKMQLSLFFSSFIDGDFEASRRTAPRIPWNCAFLAGSSFAILTMIKSQRIYILRVARNRIKREWGGGGGEGRGEGGKLGRKTDEK